ncbi:Alpha-N-acetylgalactosamine-specific lectin [Holothuria leucospilota]|uniref:Alpha-N-acetylgalactosamine-specific lectin n=1 Tax=Holothuria leucospilota TaxID=206669 RepID=A0A9Q0YH13_HOLLE|nr:Alpha-N-acetylgalactosamine-specific lectin [Holothuria leucospilota]
MAANSLSWILVVCLLANVCDVIVSDFSSFYQTTPCPHLWTAYEDNCFMMYAIPATRAEAKKECEQMQGGTLVSIVTSRDDDFLVNYWDEISPLTTDIWVGLKRNPENRQEFFWDNDVGIQHVNWLDGEPNDHGKNEDCVVYIRRKDNEGWNDRECYDKKYPFICMKPRV